MIYDARPFRNGILIELDEHQAILRERLRVLTAGTSEGRLGGPMPVRWRLGWSCTWTPVKRDAEGNLLLIFRVRHTLRPSWQYHQRVRLVRTRTLPLKVKSRVARGFGNAHT